MEPVQYLKVLRRAWLLLLLGALGGAALGLVSSRDARSVALDEGRYFVATHTLVARGEPGEGRPVAQAAFLSSVGEVPARAARELGEEPAELNRDVFVVADDSLRTLRITGLSRDPQQAVRLANVVAAHLLTVLDEQASAKVEDRRGVLAQHVQTLRGRIEDLDRRLARAGGIDRELLEAERFSVLTQYGETVGLMEEVASQSVPVPDLTTVEPARAVEVGRAEYAAGQRAAVVDDLGLASGDSAAQPARATVSEPSEGTGPLARVAFGALFGLVLAVAFVLARDRIDTRLRTKDEAEQAFALPVIAQVPPLRRAQRRTPDLVTADPYSPAAESYRMLRAALAPLGKPARALVPGVEERELGQVILVTSAVDEEARSRVVANLAAAFAETEASVVVVDCDFRRRSVESMLGVESQATPAPAATIVREVSLLQVGPEVRNPATFIASRRAFIDSARERFDVVLVDAAPLLATSVVRDLFDVADRVVVVASGGGATTWDAAVASGELLERMGAPVAGIVLTDVSSSLPSRNRPRPPPTLPPQHVAGRTRTHVPRRVSPERVGRLPESSPARPQLAERSEPAAPPPAARRAKESKLGWATRRFGFGGG